MVSQTAVELTADFYQASVPLLTVVRTVFVPYAALVLALVI